MAVHLRLRLPPRARRYAEMDKATKNSISHRYRALDKVRQHLIAATANR